MKINISLKSLSTTDIIADANEAIKYLESNLELLFKYNYITRASIEKDEYGVNSLKVHIVNCAGRCSPKQIANASLQLNFTMLLNSDLYFEFQGTLSDKAEQAGLHFETLTDVSVMAVSIRLMHWIIKNEALIKSI